MPEAIDKLFVEINALMEPFLKQLEGGMDQAVKDMKKDAKDIEQAFYTNFVKAFKDDIEGFGPDLQKFLNQTLSRMNLKDIGFREAFVEEFAAVAKDGKVLNMTFADMNAELERLATVLDTQINEAFEIVIEQISKHKKITEEDAAKIREMVAAMRLSSTGAADFGKSLEGLIASETGLDRAQSKKTRGMRRQGEEAKKEIRIFDRLSKTVSSYVKRLTTMLFGVYAIRKAWNSFNRIMRESVELYLDAVDKSEPLSKMFADLESKARAAKLEIGAVALPLRLLGEAFKTGGLMLLPAILGSVIEGATNAAKAFIILGGTIMVTISTAVTFVRDVLQAILFVAISAIVDAAQGLLSTLKPVTDFLGGPIANAASAASEKLGEFQENIAETREEFVNIKLPTTQFAEGLGEIGDVITGIDQFVQNMKELVGEIPTEAKLVATQLREAFESMMREAEEAAAKAQQRLEERLADIDRRMTRRRSDAYTDLMRDLQDIDRDINEDRLKATIDYQEAEFRLREDFALRLLELEEGYLLDLEDAVAARDARRVLMLQRRFNLEKARLRREENLRTRRLREDFKGELAEIERQRLIRINERLMEYEQELVDLKLQEERLREDAQLAWRRRMDDIEFQINKKLELLAMGFSSELQLTQEALTEAYNLYNAYYGPDGYMEAVYRYWQSILSQPGAPAAGGGAPSSRRQRGGSFVATSPMMIEVGEIPERVDVTPLSASTGRPKAGFGGGEGGEGRIEVDINLGEGLVGDIVDESMEEIAGVFIKINEGQGLR